MTRNAGPSFLESLMEKDPDVKAPAHWSPTQRRKNDRIFKLIHTFTRGALRHPVFTGSLLSLVAPLLLPLAQAERRLAEEQLQAYLGLRADDARQVRQKLETHLLQSIQECLWLAAGRYDLSQVRYDPDDWARLRRYQKDGKGMILVTGHFGNWELLAARLAQDFPSATVEKASYDPRLTAMIRHFRQSYDLTCFDRDAPDVGTRLASWLAEGKFLGVLADQDTKVPGVFVPFFGSLAHTTTGPASLHLRSGAPLVPAVIVREKDGHRIVLGPEACVDPSQERTEALLTLTAQTTAFLETMIRRHPEQWVWFHRRWKTRPGESAKVVA